MDFRPESLHHTGARTVCGVRFPNPLGVAAGIDRNGRLLAQFAASGFGFVEIGTLNHPDTARLATERLSRWRTRRGEAGLRLGVSIGTLRAAPDAITRRETLALADMLASVADFLVLNLSRPGGPGRGAAADPRPLLDDCRRHIDGSVPPLFVKLAIPPDVESVPDLARQAAALGYDGLIAAFEHWNDPTAVAHSLCTIRATLPGLAVIAVGGVRDAAAVDHYLHAGADLVQVHRLVAGMAMGSLTSCATSPAVQGGEG